MRALLAAGLIAVGAGGAAAADLVTRTEIDLLNPSGSVTGRYAQLKADTAPGQSLVYVARPGPTFALTSAVSVDRDGLQKIIDAAVRLHREVYGTDPIFPTP